MPYILTSMLMVMMFYMFDALTKSKDLRMETLRLCLQYATGVMVIFSVIFLFYTNSFLMKQRKNEIGVYNVLGMGKRHIAKMMAVETVIIAGVSMIGGLILGIIFGKMMYLILLKILHSGVEMKFAVSMAAIKDCLVLFLIIFMLTFIYNLLQVQLANPMELLRGSSQGEKEPKTRWLLALVGVLALGSGYYIALTTKEPLKALLTFFLAVVLVIIGTYALFTAGSIALLKILKILLQTGTFYNHIRDDLPDETECSRACKYLYFKYDGACNDIYNNITVCRNGGRFTYTFPESSGSNKLSD